MNDMDHQHGGDPKSTFARLGLSPRPVTDFSVNINPLGPPPCLRTAWPGWQSAMSHYPSVDSEAVRELYKTRWTLSATQVLPGNGAASLIYLVLNALGLQHVTIVTPSFHDYTRAARAAGSRISAMALSEEDGFVEPSLQWLTDVLQHSQALILGHPNNPTGTLFTRDTLLELAHTHPQHWFLVDEAFVDFTDKPQTHSLLYSPSLPRNVLVFHSLTKFYAIPGLRLGAVIGHPETIDFLRKHQPPWTVNGIAEQAALILCDDGDFETRTRQWIKTERRRFIERMYTIRGVSFILPTANYVLAQWYVTPNLDDLLRDLLEQGIFVRDCRNFPGLEKNYFRFALGQEQDNDRLWTAMIHSVEHHHV